MLIMLELVEQGECLRHKYVTKNCRNLREISQLCRLLPHITFVIPGSVSPLLHLPRQQPHEHIPDHQRLVLTRGSRQCVRSLKPVRSQDPHVPAVVLAGPRQR